MNSSNSLSENSRTLQAVGVESPFVILSNNPDNLEDGLILSQRQGTLISYTEDLNPENGNYEILLELIDPDGLFISKVFSFHHQHIREFFRSINGSTLLKDEVFIRTFREELEKLFKTQKVSYKPGFWGWLRGISEDDIITPSDNPYDEYSLDQVPTELLSRATSVASEKAYRNLSKEAASTESFVELQDALYQLGHHPKLFIKVGTESEDNQSGVRQVLITGLQISHDSGRDQVVTVKLGPFQAPSESADFLPPLPTQTNQEEGNITLFPTSNTNPYRILDGIFKNKGQYQGLRQAQLPLDELIEDNSRGLVSIIECLLQEYLADEHTLPLIFINPVLDAKIRKTIDPENKGLFNPGVITNLGRFLRECGLEILVKQDVLTKAVVERGDVFETTDVVDDPEFKIDPEDNVLRAQKLRFSWDLKIRVDDNSSKIETAKKILKRLYKKFSVTPNDISHGYVNDITHKKMIIRKLFFYGNRDTLSFYNIRNPQKIKRTNSINQFYYANKYVRKTTKYGVTNTFRANNIGILEDTEVTRGDFPDLLIMGDDFFIRSLIFPNDPGFADGAFKKYTEKLTELGISNIREVYCNASNFTGSVGKDNYTYLSYLKDYSENIYKVDKVGTRGYRDIPDELAYFITDIEAQAASKLPVFTANKKNSNVISVTSKEQGIAFAEFTKFFTLTKKEGMTTLFKALTPRRKGDTYNFDLSEDKIESISKKVLLNTYTNISMIRLIESLTNKDVMSEDTEESKNLKDYYKKFITELRDSYLVRTKKLDEDSVINYLTYLDSMAQHARSIVIKVPSQFWITGLDKMRLPVLFFHENPYISSSVSPFSKRSPLSGIYEILGYKHTITDSECYTELVLQRNVVSDTYNLGAVIPEE